MLHFQHQSFAEMLLAEYYLKIFLKFSFDDELNVEEIRVLLNLGEPTPQTIIFFKELLELLKDSIHDIESRKLLFPLIAAVGTKKYNKKAFSNSIYYEWLKKSNLKKRNSYPSELINDWIINDEKIIYITTLAKKIIESNTDYLKANVNTHNTLFDNEIISLKNENLSQVSLNIDKYLSILVGNILYNDKTKHKFFNSTIKDSKVFFELINEWSYRFNFQSLPIWVSQYFLGINTKGTEMKIIHNINLSNINFSYSNFENMNIFQAYIYTCNFNNCTFNNFYIKATRIVNTSFNKIISIKNSFFIYEEKLPPYIMARFYPTNNGQEYNRKPYLTDKQYTAWGNNEDGSIFDKDNLEEENDIELIECSIVLKNQLVEVSGFIRYGLLNSTFTIDEVLNSFDYSSIEVKDEFEEIIYNLIK
ncbi:hypothetical protein [Poseidonibacter lekithochrous]|uniref:hypothetical protein n=1 Tax=Poseidonibacter lekithochrous TaxID=1904463 RepID=UPI000D3C15F5|nr:hypothetical protein [Poseidonibacter lekithochrous]